MKEEKTMKPRTWMWMTAVSLFAALTIPVGMAAQDNASPDHKSKHQKYRLIDLGTFGGPVSQGPGEGNGGPIINSRGAVLAYAATTVPLPSNSNFFLCPFGNVNHALAWEDGRITDLGALPPSDNNCSIPQGINDRGDIAGQSENGEIDPLVGLIETRAVIWKDGRIINLGTLGGNESMADSINNRGQVVGFALNAIPDPFSIFDFLFLGSSNGTQTRVSMGRREDEEPGHSGWAGRLRLQWLRERPWPDSRYVVYEFHAQSHDRYPYYASVPLG
jgi:probable HAF family extracellular repeat protein